MRALLCACLLALAAHAWGHAGEDHDDGKEAPAAAAPQGAAPQGAASQRLADGSVFLGKPAQRELGVRTEIAAAAEHARTVELTGRVIADPNAGGRVQAAQSGRVEPGPRGLPVLGQQVAKGELVAYVRHVEDPIERSRQQASLAELETALQIARRRLARLEQLEGSVPAKEIEVARLEAESLASRRRTIGGSLVSRERLVAPASGVISVANAVAGQVVEARDVLFEVVDPDRLLVEAIAFDTAVAAGLGSATAVAAGNQRFELSFAGGGRVLREQAVPLLFRLKKPEPGLAVGQPVKVIARVAQTRKGVALPAAALVKSPGGETQVWLHVAAERFAPRRVTAEPLDGARVVVTEGLAGGEKVVVQGAPMLAQVR